jgi:predicted nucleic-acid-binding Zn-ribbon protein
VDAEPKCLTCGSTNLESGTLSSTGALHFRPKDAKFMKLTTANVDVQARLCLDCGSVALTSDVEKVKSLMA